MYYSLSGMPSTPQKEVSVSLNCSYNGLPPPVPPGVGPDSRNASCKINVPPVPSQESEGGVRFDFLFGCRLMLPAGDRYHVEIIDQESRAVLIDGDYDGGVLLCDERKFFIRYGISVVRLSDKKEIFRHDFDCKGKRVYVVIPDGALGDNLAWMPYAEEMRKVHEADVVCVIGEWMINLVATEYPKLKFKKLAGTAFVEDGYASYFCAIFPEERKSWRPIDHQHLGMQRAIAAILGLPLEAKRVRLRLGSKRAIKEPYVCVSVMATNPCKRWNFPGGWEYIVSVLKSVGYRVLDIDRENELRLENGSIWRIPQGIEDFTGPKPIQERVELLEHADFFIGGPSGLSWLAWGCKIPVVLLSGFSMPNCEFATPYRVTNYLFCHGCWNDTNAFFDMNAPIWCPRHLGTPREIECSRAITPPMVENTIRRIPEFQRREQAAKKQHATNKKKK